MQKIIKIIILFIFLFVIGIFYISLTRDINYNTSSLINKEMPKFKIISFDETNFYTRDDIKKNNFTLINFWASWCAPCKIEHPVLMKLSENKNLVILGINFKDKKILAEKFLDKLGNPYDLLAKDIKGKQSVIFGVYGIPESILINKDLMIMQKFVGPLTFDDYNNIIEIIERL
tara:strand:+ start:137 stop:658 length:522 start_codon:yes stop_codon:yes gene_type:complete